MAESAVRDRLSRAGVQRLRFDEEVYEHAQRLYNETPRPSWAQMIRTLARQHPKEPPVESTLRDWEKRGILTVESDDAPWVLGETDPDDDRLVLEVARSRLLNTVHLVSDEDEEDASWWWPSRRQARWLVLARRAAPDLDPEDAQHMALVWDLARLPLLRDTGRTAMTLVLALRPWRDDATELRNAIERGLVPRELEQQILDLISPDKAAERAYSEYLWQARQEE